MSRRPFRSRGLSPQQKTSPRSRSVPSWFLLVTWPWSVYSTVPADSKATATKSSFTFPNYSKWDCNSPPTVAFEFVQSGWQMRISCPSKRFVEAFKIKLLIYLFFFYYHYKWIVIIFLSLFLLWGHVREVLLVLNESSQQLETWILFFFNKGLWVKKIK